MLTNCPNCGAGINPGYDRCIKCGTVFPQQQPQHPVAPQPHYQQQPQQPYQPPNPNQPYHPPQPGMQYGAQTAPKSKGLAAILAFLVGCFGVHNFYLGYNTKAWWQLALSVLSGGAFVPFIFIWAWVEMVMILAGGIKTDSKGIPLGN